MRIGESYKRWRHTRGYGVHSPFAFSMIESVVHPSPLYTMYGYEDIDNSMTGSQIPHSRRHARMLLRLASFLNVKSVYLPKDLKAAPFRTALLAANSKMKITSGASGILKCDMICSRAEYVPLDTLGKFIATPGAVLSMVSVPAGWADSLFELLPEGLMFYSKTSLIIVNRPGMQKVSYSVRL